MLQDRIVLVAGGSGQVGEGIVHALLAGGARVVVPSRDPDRAQALLGDHVDVVAGELSTAGAAAALRDSLGDAGLVPTDVIASLGGWWTGADVGELDPAEWDRVLSRGLGAHFHTANTFLPVLRRAGAASYTFVNGGGALDPVPGSGAVCVSAAGQLMLGRAVAQQQAGTTTRVTTLLAVTPVLTRDRPAGREGWLTADVIGRLCAAFVGGRPLDPVVELTDLPAAEALLAS